MAECLSTIKDWIEKPLGFTLAEFERAREQHDGEAVVITPPDWEDGRRHRLIGFTLTEEDAQSSGGYVDEVFRLRNALSVGRDALEEIDEYMGGAETVLHDERVTARRKAALHLIRGLLAL